LPGVSLHLRFAHGLQGRVLLQLLDVLVVGFVTGHRHTAALQQQHKRGDQVKLVHGGSLRVMEERDYR